MFDEWNPRDRIKFTTKLTDEFTLLGIIEKNVELDSEVIDPDANASTLNSYNYTTADMDSDAYYVAGIYQTEGTTVGLLLANVRSAVSSTTLSTKKLVDPYFDVKFDNFGIKGEFQFWSGEEETDGTPATTKDISRMGAYLAATGQFGDTTVEVGYAMASGDENSTDDKMEDLSLGTEWTPFVILQDANGLINNAGSGANLIYAQVDYQLNDKIKLTGLFGNAKAAAIVNKSTKGDSFGTEIDAKLEWKVMDSLTYNFNFGYLMAGDVFQSSAVGASEPEDTFTIYHQVELTF
jgi:hypothetical protein